MKLLKFFSIIFLYVILGLTVLIIFSVNSGLSSESDYNVICREFQVNIVLEDDGDAKVKYTFDTHLNKSYSVRYFTFEKSNYSMDIDSLQINDIEYQESINRAPLEDMNPSEFYSQYYFGEENNNYIIEYYFPRIENQDQKVELEFTLNDFVKVHNDVADLYYMIAKSFDMPFYHLNVNVTLPSNVDASELYAFGYGPVDGVIGENKTTFFANNIDVNERFEIRLLMPSENFPNAPKINDNILEAVLAENEYFKTQTRINGYIIYISVAALVIMLTYSIFYSLRIKAQFPRFKGVNQGSINRVPNNIDPILAGKLYQFYKLDNDSNLFTSSLLDLAHRNIIKLEEQGDKHKAIFTYQLMVEDYSNLNGYEIKLLDLLFKTISKDDKTVSDKDIENYAKKSPTNFANRMKLIYADYKKHFDKYKWIDNEMTKYDGKRFIPLALNLLTLLISVFIYLLFPLLNNILILLFGSLVNIFLCLTAILITSGARFRRLNQTGEDKYEEVKGFYTYLDEYTLLNEKLAADIVMWEKYLVYAAAFGIADKVLKQLEVKFKDPAYASRYHNSYIYTFYALNSRGINTSTAIKSFGSTTFSPARYVSNSGGGAGGFSGGGGGGMGGGGSGGR